MAFLDPVLNPLLQPLLSSSPILGILVIALIVSILITLVYKFMTNQAEMKRLKDQQKEFQGRMKELRDKPEEMMKVQKEAMKLNMEYMKHSFKPTLITMLPILLIFGWMSGHLAFEPIYPGESFSITAQFSDALTGNAVLMVDEGVNLISPAEQEIADNKATWNLKSSEGTHYLKVTAGEQEQQKKVLITKDLKYEEAISTYQHSEIEVININYNKLLPLGHDFTVPLFDWQPGWLGVYIVFSIIFSIGLRKALKLY